jgi:hypothetical protein
MIKALQELCQTPLYKSAKISIRPNLQDLVGLDETIGSGGEKFDANLQTKKLDTFKEVVKMKIAYTLLENILSLEHIIDDNDKSITITL